jgi:hypothetical protein
MKKVNKMDIQLGFCLSICTSFNYLMDFEEISIISSIFCPGFKLANSYDFQFGGDKGMASV